MLIIIYMKKSHSCDSFFKYIPNRPLISCFSKFIKYTKDNDIKLNNKSKKSAYFIFLNSLKRPSIRKGKKKFLKF